MTYHTGVDEMWSQAERQRLMQSIAVLPDPRRVAESLSHAALCALIHAQRDRAGGYKLPRSQRDTSAWKQLVAAGIVESGWGGIGSFGEKVRNSAIKMRLQGEID
jgi:hypothetical protein